MKIGTKVKMVNCLEAEENKDKVWVTRSEPWDLCGTMVVLLECKSGGFSVDCLEVIDEGTTKTNVIKAQFLRNDEPQGREYTYYTPVEVSVGDIIELESRAGKAKGTVTQVNVPEEEIAPFKDKAKSIIGIWVEETEANE